MHFVKDYSFMVVCGIINLPEDMRITLDFSGLYNNVYMNNILIRLNETVFSFSYRFVDFTKSI